MELKKLIRDIEKYNSVDKAAKKRGVTRQEVHDMLKRKGYRVINERSVKVVEDGN